jgi:uncharacterized protein Smg (DUF494 family)
MQYYTPKISKKDYCKRVLQKAQEDYFDGDVVQFVEFLLNQNTLTPEQKEAMVAMLR